MLPVPERWSGSVEVPDMWVDPSDDPRESRNSPPEGELETVQRVLADYRLTLVMKCDGLSPEQLARRSVPPSTMSLLGLLRHLVEVERDWRTWLDPAHPTPKLYGGRDADFDGAVADACLVARARTDLASEQEATDALLTRRTDRGERLEPVGVTVRELWARRIEEYARHCGHADLLRECVDGRVGQ